MQRASPVGTARPASTAGRHQQRRPGRGSSRRTRPSLAPSGPAPTHTTSPDGAQRVEVGRAGSRPPGPAARRPRAPRRAGPRPAATPSASTRASSPRRGAPTPCHAGRKRARAAAVDRLDLPAQRGQRPPPQLAQHVVVAPLALDAVGPELAPHDAALRPRARSSAGTTRSRPSAEAPGDLRGQERPVGAGVAGDQVDRAASGDRVGEGRGQPEREGHARARRGSRAASSAAAHARPRRRSTRAMARRSATQLRRPTPSAGAGPVATRSVELRDATGRRARAAGRAPRRRRGPAGRRPGAAARARGRPARPGRAARAAPRPRAGRAAGRGRAPAPRPGARPAARRPRTCRRRSSRTAATGRTATPAACRPPTTRTRRGAQVGQHLAQRRQVEHVLQALAGGLEQDREVGYLAATASRSAARWRCCHSGVRRSGRRRGSSRARAAHSRKRAANSGGLRAAGPPPARRSRRGR